jgi:ferredoxin
MSVKVKFLPDNITVNAEVGESLLNVASRAKVFIATGCLMGSCHACEVELSDGTIICACINSVPSGVEELTIHIFDDPVW